MPKTLLVVDDSDTIRQAARLALAGEDWQVSEALGARDALEAVAAGAPDAVLCSATLGGADGYELSRRLRRLPEMGLVPILLMGAKADPERARAAGATATLPKPFGARELLTALRGAAESQAFAGGLTADSALDDAPLSLDELDGPLAPGTAGADLDLAQEVEVIDLSAGEDFEELDLIEDLEPLAPEPRAPAAALWEPAPAEPVEAAGGGDLVFDLGDLGPGADPSRRGAAEDLDLGDLFPAAERRGAGEAPAPPDEAFEQVLELEPALEVVEPETWGALEGASEHGAPVAPPLEARNQSFWGEEAPPAPWAGEAGADVAAAADRAVRAALDEHLTAERLLPAIQAVVERVVWEVVPPLAERLIQEAIDRLREEPPRP